MPEAFCQQITARTSTHARILREGRSLPQSPRTFPRRGTLGRLLLAFELELLYAVPDLVAIQAEERRRAGLVPAAPFERLHDERPLQLLDVDAGCGEFHPVRQAGHRGTPAHRKLVECQLVPFDE